MLLFWCVRSQTLTFKEEIGLSANACTHTCTCIYSTWPWYCQKVLLCATSCYNLWYRNKWPTGGDGRVRQFTVRGFLNSIINQTHRNAFTDSHMFFSWLFVYLSLINQTEILLPVANAFAQYTTGQRVHSWAVLKTDFLTFGGFGVISNK